MIDKLTSVQKRNQRVSYVLPASSETLTVNTESPRFAAHLSQGIEEQFMDTIKTIKKMIQRIKHNNTIITQVKQRYEQTVKATQEKNCSTQIQRILDENSKHHKDIKKLIGALKVNTERSQKDALLRDEPETKMKKNMLMAISQQAANILQQQRVHEDAFKGTVRSKITRQAKLIDPSLTEGELDHYANNPDQMGELLTKKVGMASIHLKYAVADIKEKCEDIKQLERSVNECLYLFKQLSEMIYAQGQQIDNIELNCQEAKDYIQKGGAQIIKAKKREKCKKKCCCWSTIIGIIVGVIVVCVVIPIAIKSVKPF